MNATQKNMIADWKERAKQLHGIDKTQGGISISTSLQNTFDEIEKQSPDETIKFLKEAEHDEDKQKQLSAVRLFQFSQYIMPQLTFGRFFNIEVLAPEDYPVIYNDSPTETTCTYIGDANKPKTLKIEAEQTSQTIQLNYLATERVRYKVMDIYRGPIDQNAQRLFDLAFDMANQIDALQYDLLTGTSGAYGDIKTTGSKSARHYIANSRVKSVHLPITNDITVGVPTSSTTFSTTVLREITKYCQQWGSNLKDGPLLPTGDILIPSIDIHAFGDDITNTVESNPYTDRIHNQGFYQGVSHLGVNWRFIPVNTIDSGKCYPIFNKPVGTMFLKPSMDYEKVVNFQNNPEMDPNWEQRWMVKVVGLVIPWTRRINTARFYYKT